MKKTVYTQGIIFGIIFIAAGFILGQPAHAQTPVSREYFTFHNLVRNGSFESFDQAQGLPAEWTINDTSKVSLLNDPYQVKVGAVSLNLSGPVKFTQDIRDWKGIEGSNVALGVWMKGNSGDSVKLFVDDGVNRQEKAVSLTDTSWKYVTLKTATAINGSASSLKIEVEVVSTASGISLDGVMLSQVTKGVAFVPNPDDQEKSPQDLIYTDGVSGNVGIGTNAPQTPLDVAGEIHTSDKVTVGENNEELLTSTASDEKYLNDDRDETLDGNLNIGKNLTVTGTVSSLATPLLDQLSAESLYVKKSGDTILGDLIVNGLLTLNIGKVLNDLEVTGLVKAGRFEGDGSGLTNILSQWKSSSDGTGIYFDQGNVGIGTTSPQAQLTLSSGSGILITKGADANTPYARFFVNGDQVQLFGWDNDDGAKSLILNPDGGNVGIGTTSPGARLHVAGGGSWNPEGSGIFMDEDGNQNPRIELRGASPYIDFTPFTTSDSDFLARIGLVGEYLNIYGPGGGLSLNTSNGNVGIGTASPAGKLHVNTGTDQNLFVTAGPTYAGVDGIALVSTNTANTAYKDLNIAAKNIILNASGGNGNVGIGTTNPLAQLTLSSGSGILITEGADANTPYVRLFMSGDQARLASWDNDGGAKNLILNPDGGNVGIGTTSPQNLLDLGTSNGKKLAVYQNPGGSDFYGLGIASETLEFYAGATSTATPSIVLKNTGNVGIGTTSPVSKFDVMGAVRVTGTSPLFPSSGKGLELWYDSDAPDQGVLIAYDRTAALYKKLVLDGSSLLLNSGSGGNVGIGTTSPISELHVQNHDTSWDYNGAALRLSMSNDDMYFYRPDENRFAIQTTMDGDASSAWSLSLNPNGGSVGIGTTAPTAKLHISDPASVAVVRIESTAVGGSAQLNINSAAAGYPHILFTQGGAGRFEIGQVTNNGNFYFNNNTQTGESGSAMVISKAGNVGIGTTNPTQQLTIDAGGSTNGIFIKSTDASRLLLGNYPSGSWGWMYYDNNLNLMSIGTLSNSGIRITASGIGIRKDNPAYTLDVSGDINGDRLCIGTDCRTAWPGSGGSVDNVWSQSGSDIYYNSGNVAIGTTSTLASRFFVSADSSNNAIQAESSGGVGVFGKSTSASWAGVHGYNSSSGPGIKGYAVNGYGLYASSENNYAGYFDGNIKVAGNIESDGEICIGKCN